MRNLIRIPDGTTIVAEKLLGAGGQGEVWRALVDGAQVAAKVYHRHTATQSQREALERLVAKGPPARCFLWPISLVEDRDQGTFGYIMPLRESRFRSLEDFMARRIESSMRAILTAGLQLTDGFLKLHSRGLCYRDVSFANVFFDPATGDVRICDNDNVDVVGSKIGGVLGTQRFMAPEVVRREADPTDDTDRYSLAVLLFFLLHGGHPLDGAREARIRCLDVPALEKLYGTEPLYIWDPSDPSNRPTPGVHDNPITFKAMWPSVLGQLFQVSFTEGLHYPTKRVRESEWRKAFSRAIDSIWICGCGAENFFDDPTVAAPGTQKCWSCKRVLLLPARILIGNDTIILNRGSRLYPHHVGQARDDEQPIAEVVPSPSNPSLFGLRNLTTTVWGLTRDNGSIADVPPGRAAPILSGNRINFGTATGELRV